MADDNNTWVLRLPQVVENTYDLNIDIGEHDGGRNNKDES